MIAEVYTGPDRRRTPRIKYEGVGQIMGRGADGLMHSETCSFVNLSEGGCCVKSPINFGEGLELNLTFKLPGLLNIFVRTTVKVVWCTLYPVERCYLAGLVFERLHSYDLTALRSFLLSESKKDGKEE